MFLAKLRVKNFRSYILKELDFSPDVNLVIGSNAIGKTNLLEAIYLLAVGKSFHAKKEEEMINNRVNLAAVKGRIVYNHDKMDLEIMITKGEIQLKKIAKKLFKVNAVAKKWKDFAGVLKCVLFRPEDIDIILGTPTLRRQFLNNMLEQIDWQYRGCHLAYKKALRNRNKLLSKIRENEATPNQLFFWDQVLIKNGAAITQKREELINFFNELLKERHLNVFYDKSIISEARLLKYHDAEVALGVTLVGPHRDDIKIYDLPQPKGGQGLKIDDGRDLGIYGSRGEQRMAIFYLKLAELDYFENKTKERPVLLLDDIFSELDQSHRREILVVIKKQQTIITATDTDVLKNLVRDKIKIIKLL